MADKESDPACAKASFGDLDPLGHLDAVAGDAAPIGDGLDACGPGAVEGFAVAGVDVAGQGKTPRRADLDQEQHHRAVAGRHHVGEFHEVLRAALGHRVRKFGKARAAHQMHVLDLDIAALSPRCFEQEVHPRILAVLHLAADARIACELADRVGGDRLRCEPVGMAGIDAHELGAAAEIDLDQLPAMGELALGIVGFRQPDTCARRVEPGHRAGVGAMDGDGFARGQHHVGKKALVALDQRGGQQRNGKAHASSLV